MQQGVAFSNELFEDNKGALAVTVIPPRFDETEHNDVRWPFVKTKVITVMHIESVGSVLIFLQNRRLFRCIKGT